MKCGVEELSRPIRGKAGEEKPSRQGKKGSREVCRWCPEVETDRDW